MMRAGQDAVMVVRTLTFMVMRQVLDLIGLGPSPHAKDVEIAVLKIFLDQVGGMVRPV
jgi:hypothetical protein